MRVYAAVRRKDGLLVVTDWESGSSQVLTPKQAEAYMALEQGNVLLLQPWSLVWELGGVVYLESGVVSGSCLETVLQVALRVR